MGPVTQFEFLLPRGYTDGEGRLHRNGTMRLATARDALSTLHDPRVRSHGAYRTMVLLSRVITRLGTLDEAQIVPELVEQLALEDVRHLQALYRRINATGRAEIEVLCPSCGSAMRVDPFVATSGARAEVQSGAPQEA